MRVFHREHAGRPIRVVWTLEELGQPYELSVMTREEGKGEEHRRRHPLGRVPVLEDDEGPVFESAAICLHLAELNPDVGLLAPPGTHDRALAYQWTVFAPAELEPPLIEAAVQAERDPERSAKARERFEAAARAVSEALEGREYLVGDRFGIADVLIGTTLGFTKRTSHTLPEDLEAYVTRLQRRPAYERALARAS